MSLFNLVNQETRLTLISQSSHVMLLQILLTIFIIIEIHVWLRMIWLSCEIFCNWTIEDHYVLLRFRLLRWRWYSCFMLFNSTHWILMWADDFVFLQWRTITLQFWTYVYWLINIWSWNVKLIQSWHQHVILLSLHLVVRLSSLWMQWFRTFIILCKDHLLLICCLYTYFIDLS